MSSTILVEMTEIICTCGIPFTVPTRFDRNRRENGTEFFCPSGHKLSYGENDLTKTKTALAQADKRMAELRKELTQALKAADRRAGKDGLSEMTAEPPMPLTQKEKVMAALKLFPMGATAANVCVACPDVNKQSVASVLSELARSHVIDRSGTPFVYILRGDTNRWATSLT
jgi:hypothetical protein